jgi:O-acetyl-ADP-ribose deacetylase (regulator of RNase III)
VSAELDRALARMEADARARDGVASQAEWHAEDGWVIIYTTSRVEGGPHAGKFVTQAFRPVGKGARTGQAATVKQVYRREFSTRKAAKARAVALYRQHSPKWAARHPETDQ